MLAQLLECVAANDMQVCIEENQCEEFAVEKKDPHSSGACHHSKQVTMGSHDTRSTALCIAVFICQCCIIVCWQGSLDLLAKYPWCRALSVSSQW